MTDSQITRCSILPVKDINTSLHPYISGTANGCETYSDRGYIESVISIGSIATGQMFQSEEIKFVTQAYSSR
ncbi:DEHA2A02068p [Debaryomyces hansenii CBS767]|uniref:DEHA2A02068p n=1 Tax=Debaryomyces hansenii (strain ATCC 36239 / CBS 767 / BCRC 21394 / JCM 1990 / NBRC 0083 / IGC 2968) TaxID=284592 RepID=B5RSP2_DEBHA|nr:DEHA2A02068p [Debaryomyces hansenii CBS767]CAR65348.1 DEHA2A02068p [Debaryomyces hansenii CBS767]|eukprot:XP_002769955.1 DEHA2A02068p [Debaryomyces hansenii CBS767]